MKRSIALTTFLVHDYDEAIEYFVKVLGFVLREDSDLGAGKRWVVVASDQDDPHGLLLALAVGDDQRRVVGNQTGGRVFQFLHTDDFERDYARFRDRGVKFLESPRHESYGSVAVFADLWGNKWDLLERNDGAQS
ncbi:MAG: VOC family protein [Pseudomonadota bacterium]